MERIYFDQAATSFPKAPGVANAMKYYIEDVGASINRGVYGSAISAEETVWETREAISSLFNFTEPENVIFTLNITQSLNFLLKGILRPGDHCIVSSLEHNAVMRPLVQLSALGVSYTRIKGSPEGFIDSLEIKKAIRPNTRMVMMTHASNVCGSILPLQEIGMICREQGIFFVADCAQTAGSLTVDFEAFNLSALAFTGHKGLLGPQGIGGFLIRQDLAAAMQPLIAGGTGSLSDREEIPPYLPDKFEAGTPNIPGIFGLQAALRYLVGEGIENLHSRAMALTAVFLDGVNNIEGIEPAGPKGVSGRTAIVSLNFPGRDNGEIAYTLDKHYGIMTRSGLHCAPSAHQTLGTFPHGTVRFSFSPFNTPQQVHYALDTLARLMKS